jgi:hypothetical protein
VLCLLKALIGWVVLMFVGTNLLGLIVRGLVPNSGMDELEHEGDPFIQEQVAKYKRTNVGMTSFFAVLALIYFYLLFHFWNIGVVAVAATLMGARLPDLLFEIRTGQKVNKWHMPRGPLNVFTTLLDWVALPVLWWALCRALPTGVERTTSTLMLLVLLALLYFTPTWLAFARNHPKRMAIGVLNLFGGWTVIGWLIAFAWAWPWPTPRGR